MTVARQNVDHLTGMGNLKTMVPVSWILLAEQLQSSPTDMTWDFEISDTINAE